MAALWVWPAGAASYLVLAGSLSADEIAVAVMLGALGAGWHAAILNVEARRFAFGLAAVREIGRALAGLPGATLRVGSRLATAILRGAAGRQAEVPFSIGDHTMPAEAGRRALVVLATSLAPDSYVLRIPENEGSIQYHALTARMPGGDRRWPA